METSQPTGPATGTGRIASVDAYRGLVMLLMMAEVLEFGRIARSFPESAAWRALAQQQSHVEWRGCSLHDLIQPSFSFLVGVALTFSLAGRRRRGERAAASVARASWRALVLVALGIFLRSVGRPATNYTFEDTLTQIGLGYLPLSLIGMGPKPLRPIALGAILVGYWAAFALHPLPGPGFDYASVGVPAEWPHHATGLAAHWDKNSNLAWAFDRWFLNLFPRAEPFTHNGGGYATLSFIPTLGTMLLGLFAGDWLREESPGWRKAGRLAGAGVICLGAGLALDAAGVCPSVKRIWTPSWTLLSGGYCFLLMAAFYSVIDWPGWRAWSFPLRVIGMNSIAAYVLSHLIGDFLEGTYRTHLGRGAFHALGEPYEPLLMGAAVLATYWLILLWMDRKGLYLRV